MIHLDLIIIEITISYWNNDKIESWLESKTIVIVLFSSLDEIPAKQQNGFLQKFGWRQKCLSRWELGREEESAELELIGSRYI